MTAEGTNSLYRRYTKPLYYFLLKLSGSQQLAEDLVQETFVRATISLFQFQVYGAVVTGPVKELLKLKENEQIKGANLGEITYWNWAE